MIKIRRGCGSWECMCGTPHSLPYKVEGKCGSVTVRLLPAPKGTGLCIEKELAKMLKLAGITDVYSKTFGKTKTKINIIKACENALRILISTKIQPHHLERLSILEGESKEVTEETLEEAQIEN